MAYASDLCGSKLRSKLSSVINESNSQPIASTSFAAKQMAKMGWQEGTGLGKKRDGITSHIKVVKREENVGLGTEKEKAKAFGVEGMWWSHSVSETLLKLQQKKVDHEKKKKKKKEKKQKNDDSDNYDDDIKTKKRKKDNDTDTNSNNDNDSDHKEEEPKPKKQKKDKAKNKQSTTLVQKIYTDEELFVATGGARFGMRAQRRAEGKWSRTESSDSLRIQEEYAKMKKEWNGLGHAKVLLNGATTGASSKNNSIRSSLSSCSSSDDDDEEKKSELQVTNCTNNSDDELQQSASRFKKVDDKSLSKINKTSTSTKKSKDKKKRKDKSEKKSKQKKTAAGNDS